ncbi:MAG: S24/S26 family peptidase [Clostridia bacterium]|nr:S24/S26 family peptidase [Clostridia bacterium]
MSEGQKLTIEEVLATEGKYVGPTVGVSMLPMLKNRRDTIVVRPKTERLKPLDVALYRRGEAYVLHRVLSVTETGYIIRGDNCYSDEVVPEEAVFGVLTEFFRKNKHYYCTDEKYLNYAKRRIKTYKIRRFFVIIKSKLRAVAKTVLRWLVWKGKKGKNNE